MIIAHLGIFAELVHTVSERADRVFAEKAIVRLQISLFGLPFPLDFVGRQGHFFVRRKPDFVTGGNFGPREPRAWFCRACDVFLSMHIFPDIKIEGQIQVRFECGRR